MKDRVYREHVPAAAVLQAFGWTLAALALCFALILPRGTGGDVVALVTVDGACLLFAAGALLAAHRTPARRIILDERGVRQVEAGFARQVSWHERIVVDEEIVAREAPAVWWWWPAPITQYWCVVTLKSRLQQVRFSARILAPPGVEPRTLPRVRADDPEALGVPLAAPRLREVLEAVEERLRRAPYEPAAHSARSASSAGSSQERR